MQETKAIHHLIAPWLGVALLLVQSLVHAETGALERIEWKKIPIRLALVVGQEQRIEFPASVKVGVSASVQGRLKQNDSWCANSTAVGSIYSMLLPPRMALPAILFKSMLRMIVAAMILVREKMIRVQDNPTTFN